MISALSRSPTSPLQVAIASSTSHRSRSLAAAIKCQGLVCPQSFLNLCGNETWLHAAFSRPCGCPEITALDSFRIEQPGDGGEDNSGCGGGTTTVNVQPHREGPGWSHSRLMRPA